MEVQEGIDDSLKILQLARAGRRVYLFNLLRRTAKQQGVYVSDVIVEMKDSQSRGIAHYCAEGASVAAEGILRLCLLELQRDYRSELKSAFINATNTEGQTALIEAAKYGQGLMIEMLVQNGAEVNHEDDGRETAIYSAVRAYSLEAIKSLVQLGATVNHSNADGWSPLHAASALVDEGGKKDPESIGEYLVECGALTNAVDNYGHTPLHVVPWAANNTNRMLLLIEKMNYNTNVADWNGWTPFHHAVAQPYVSDYEVETLSTFASNPNATDRYGQAPLHVACANLHGHKSSRRIVKDMHSTRNDLNVNIQDSNGDTPLHVAIRANNWGAASYLIEKAGADIHIANNDGLKVFVCALREVNIPLHFERLMIDRLT